MLETLISWDTSITLLINSLHCGYLDNFMMMYSGRFIWIPLYLSLFIVMLRNFPLKVNIVCLVAIVLLVTLCDQVSSTLLRPYLARMRPANLLNPISDMVHVVDNYRGGRYGFPSSHAANCWGAAIFVFYIFRRKVISIVFALWAFVMCWSRIYLGVHYVGDILFGTFVGFAIASIEYYIFQYTMHQTTEAFKPKVGCAKLYLPCIVCEAEVLLMLILACFTRFSF